MIKNLYGIQFLHMEPAKAGAWIDKDGETMAFSSRDAAEREMRALGAGDCTVEPITPSELLNHRIEREHDAFIRGLSDDGLTGENMLLYCMDAAQKEYTYRSIRSNRWNNDDLLFLTRFQKPLEVLSREFVAYSDPLVHDMFPYFEYPMPYDGPSPDDDQFYGSVSKQPNPLFDKLPKLEAKYSLIDAYNLPTLPDEVLQELLVDKILTQCHHALNTMRVGFDSPQLKEQTNRIDAIKHVRAAFTKEHATGLLRLCDVRLLLADDDALEHLLETAEQCTRRHIDLDELLEKYNLKRINAVYTGDARPFLEQATVDAMGRVFHELTVCGDVCEAVIDLDELLGNFGQKVQVELLPTLLPFYPEVTSATIQGPNLLVAKGLVQRQGNTGPEMV